LQTTIYDIAREAGVSIATVSRVFNNNPNVSAATREHVLNLAREHGYHPKAIAQGLARRHTKTIMALVPMLSNYFFMEVLAGLQDRISDSDYDLHIFNIKGFTSPDELYDQLDYVMRKGQADAYILISCHLRDDQWRSLLKKYRSPAVLVDEHHDAFDSISVDSIRGAYLATKHLLELGHRRVGVIAASESSKPIQDRVTGYSMAMYEAGFSEDDSRIYRGDDNYRDGFSEIGGYQAMLKILEDPYGPDAVFCTSDIQSLGALKAMQDVGRSIPLVSFDDIQIAHFLGLSTMRQPMYDMGTLAIEYLLERLEGGSEAPPKNTVFLPELIVRD
jgi:LacI family transcriptional regulator